MHPPCIYCHLPVWEVEPLIGRAFQGRETPKGWLHFDCPEPTFESAAEAKVRREEQRWQWDEDYRRGY